MIFATVTSCGKQEKTATEQPALEAVEYSNLHFSDDQKSIVLDLTIDTEISSVLEYFEIFMERMLLSKRAALFFDKKFKMYINGSNIL